jgi:hypothetical protein
MKKFILSSTLILVVFIAKADEGMWLLSLLNQNYEKMQEMGLTMSVEEIYSINNASMKDAVVRFGGGCTGEIISNQGLLLTNHHCGFGAIQRLSTPENNILANGFWAKTHANEIPCEGLTATFFIRMEEVTHIILEDFNDEMTEQERRELINKRSRVLENEHGESGKYQVRIAGMFNGNAFYMFIYEVYNDVRLVGVAPESMGKFGGEADNWTWPRHTADFALFRVYSNVDGKPAKYSKENIPLVPKWFFPVSTAGIKEGDFAMIVGFPGSTDRFLTSYGVKMAIEEKGPTIVNARDVKLKSWREFRNVDPVIDLQYAAKYAGISNYWKYYIGQTQQLTNNEVFAKKKKIEDDFQAWVYKNDKKEYFNVPNDIAKAHEELTKYEKINNLYSQAVFAAAELFSLASGCRSIYELLQKQEKEALTATEQKQLETRCESLKARLDDFFKNYNLEVDKATAAKMLEHFFNESTHEQRPQFFNDAVKKSGKNFKKITEELFKKTMFSNRYLLENFLHNPNISTLEKDKTFRWYTMFSDFYNKMMEPVAEQRENLARANRLFVRGLLEMNPDKLYAPSANGQIRLTYGKIGGYPIKDGFTAEYFTTLEGVMAKEDPTNREFIVDEKLKALFKNKDYGQYAEDGRIRVNFLTDHDITGGNSGSPVINAKGELVGCAFDGNWEAMSGDIFFEPALQRSINVDVRYVLFIIDKFGGAKHLIDEMKIVP